MDHGYIGCFFGVLAMAIVVIVIGAVLFVGCCILEDVVERKRSANKERSIQEELYNRRKK